MQRQIKFKLISRSVAVSLSTMLMRTQGEAQNGDRVLTRRLAISNRSQLCIICLLFSCCWSAYSPDALSAHEICK